MPKLPGVNHLRAVKALEKAGSTSTAKANTFSCQKAPSELSCPRNNPVDAYTMAAIVRDAGLTIEQFKDLL